MKGKAWHIRNVGAKGLCNGCLAGKDLNREICKVDPQRLSPWGRVKPQAKGGRKMLLYDKKKVIDEDIVYAGMKVSEVCRWR